MTELITLQYDNEHFKLNQTLITIQPTCILHPEYLF